MRIDIYTSSLKNIMHQFRLLKQSYNEQARTDPITVSRLDKAQAALELLQNSLETEDEHIASPAQR